MPGSARTLPLQRIRSRATEDNPCRFGNIVGRDESSHHCTGDTSCEADIGCFPSRSARRKWTVRRTECLQAGERLNAKRMAESAFQIWQGQAARIAQGLNGQRVSGFGLSEGLN